MFVDDKTNKIAGALSWMLVVTCRFKVSTAFYSCSSFYKSCVNEGMKKENNVLNIVMTIAKSW